MLWIPEDFSGFTQDSELVGKWVCEKSGGSYHQGATGIGIVKHGKLEVGIMYDGYTGRGGSIMMSSRCDNPKATSKWFYWAIFDYPFNQLGVKRITGFVPAWNLAAQRFDEHLGFVREATLEDVLPEGDLIIYRMKRQDCRWLTLKENLDGLRI